jgi:3-keto-5-aminohexanoate cleavage enzyme
MEPLIITVAPVGAELTLEQTPHLPITPSQLAETTRRCCEAGASIVHVHCRDDDGANTHEVARFREAQAALRASCDAIVQFSTGGAIGMTPQERAAPLELRPDMATLTCGTVNFGDEIFENSFPIIRGIIAEATRYGVRLSLEIFDAGHLTNAKRLLAKGLLHGPLHAEFVLGVPGGMEAEVSHLCDLHRELPGGWTWSVAAMGRAQLPMAMAAMAMGGHVRVGLEDNIYYERGRLATNEELVARIARIARELGRPVATPREARRILALP